MSNQVFAPLQQALDHWAASGRVAPFWLRDDDAIKPTEALDRFLGLTGRYPIPATLAVIPAGTGPQLAERLASEEYISIAVHGWSHTNHAGLQEKKQELGAHRPADVVLDELSQGYRLLADLHGQRFVPLLVPPWNRIDSALVPRLPELGFRALSVYGREKQAAIPLVNTHVDVMDWHGTRGGRDAGALVGEIVARLTTMFDTGSAMGLLTHHLVHDEAVWSFMQALFEATSDHPGCRWVAVAELLAPAP
ncbi:peptidoglycan/xylan/chitin deacetylase (PgdA/CDA1 family) [Pararhizobium capsulatum DSM 1112]|uniref:Chitooligosaccharide deacetylase n=1 Tax=Pararhizobium capsulatum DSM 1112 TaxID=1121113 RepID=A0ABU0BTA3_9HYPH|nr:polysaccharide deacetylase family protein [Pararhizobium capsulatum]MDQ0321496.1 peptidoglycan/xylan/chitin deacetylase (PgdA/CDA1 family) [Pararhizobium capsulatum DSM 1112]